jgi:hypothetical protein
VPAGSRFSTGFLDGLAAWAAAKQKEQTVAAPVRAAPAASADAPATEAAAAAAAASYTADAGELAAVTRAFAALQPMEIGQSAAQPVVAASPTSGAPVAADCSSNSAAADDLRFVPQLVSSQHQESGTVHQGTASVADTTATNDVSDSGAAEPDELRDDASSAPAPQPGVHCNGSAAAVRQRLWPDDEYGQHRCKATTAGHSKRLLFAVQAETPHRGQCRYPCGWRGWR